MCGLGSGQLFKDEVVFCKFRGVRLRGLLLGLSGPGPNQSLGRSRVADSTSLFFRNHSQNT